ncbi:MAG: hypothetical protein ACQKBW_06060 [Puniceicoccales bacterium]
MEDLNNFRLQKISMIVADVLLVLLGVIFAFSGEGPMAPMQFFWVVVCIGLGGVLAFIPFFLEFKIRANLAEYDRSQANLENAERIERVLAEIHEVAATIARQTDRSEEALAKTSEAVERLEKHQPTGGSDGEETKALAASVEALRKDVATALDSVASADDTTALVGGIEVSLTALAGQLEHIQYQLARDASERTATVEDLPPEPESEADEAVEPSVREPDPEPEPAPDSDVDGLIMPEEDLPEKPVKLEPGDTLPDGVGEDETVKPEEGLLAEDHIPVAEPGSAEEALEGAEDVSEDFEEKDEALDAVVHEAAVLEAEADQQAAAEAQKGFVAGDNLPDEVGEDEEVEPEKGLLAEDHNPVAEPGSAEEALEGAEDVPEDFKEKEEALDAAVRVAEEESEPEDDGPVFTDARPVAEEPSQPNLMDDLPPPRQKPRKSPKGSTVLIAQVLIGIGNKPYIRGNGPGLSPNEGVPMEFLEIGKWQWTAPEGDEPISCQIYKNDETPADGEPIELEPGQRRTVSPVFKR